MIRRCWLVLLILAVLVFGSCKRGAPTLNLLVWEGYADPSFVQAFEEANHCKVSASYMGSSDELMAKLRGGSAGNYDVISPSSDVATSIATWSCHTWHVAPDLQAHAPSLPSAVNQHRT